MLQFKQKDDDIILCSDHITMVENVTCTAVFDAHTSTMSLHPTMFAILLGAHLRSIMLPS